MEMESAILRYYNEGRERDRLTAQPSLELIRSQVLLRRFLPGPPARVLDVGGASGVYASWLAGLGYTVDLVDPIPLHVEQASALGGFSAALGDARDLTQADHSYDAALLMGPLYHLTERTDRVQSFAEAARVTRPGGVVLAAAISRYASAFEGYFRGFIDRPGFLAGVREVLRTGQHRNPGNDQQVFTTAYFHDRDGLAAEASDAGLVRVSVLPIESMLSWSPAIAERLADPEQRELVLEMLATIEQDPAVTNATSHLLAVGWVE